MSADEKGEYKEIFEKALEISRLLDRGFDPYLKVHIDSDGVQINRVEYYRPNAEALD